MSKKKKRYAARLPQQVRGGIRAQSAGPQGGSTRVWWSRRWLAFLENYRLGARLGRGRSYAVAGQVSALRVEAGEVTAAVQGADKAPYRAEIRFAVLSEAAKARVTAALRQQPMLLARLLIGDLPERIEGLLQEEGCPLFPQREQDLSSRCTCPDYVNPCKHLAAVYCLLGEAVTTDPLLLLALRGLDRVTLFGPETPSVRTPAEKASHMESVPETGCGAAEFYGTPQAAFEDFGPAPRAVLPAPLISRLGPLPFWRGQERFVDTLEPLYARAASRGWTVWSGEPLDLRREEEKVILRGATLHLKQRRMRADPLGF
jgi:uncharacterized Zn finger protein